MYAIHEDLDLTPEQQQRVLDYVQAVGFSLPGATPEDFTAVVPHARYAGWDFMSEDLHSYIVGLICSKPGFEKKHTFIRVSHAQLMGQENTAPLAVNDPVLATDALRMQRWRDTETGPSRTGVHAYAPTDGSRREPAVELDLRIIGDTLSDILAFHSEGKTKNNIGYFDLQVDWGIVLAGRYQRLNYLRDNGRLTQSETAAYTRLEQRMDDSADVLAALHLPTRRQALQPEVRRHRAHHH